MECVLTAIQRKHITSDAYIRPLILKNHHIAIVYSCKTDAILASGTNAVEPKKNCAVHAEVAAMTQFRKRVRDGVIKPSQVSKGIGVLSIRVAKAGHLLNAKPCTSCSKVIDACPFVKRVEWSIDNGEIVMS